MMPNNKRTPLLAEAIDHISQASGLPVETVALLKGDTASGRMRNALIAAPHLGAIPDYALAEIGPELYANG